MFYNQHYSETTLQRATDFVKLAEAFGATGLRADNAADFEKCVKQAFAADGPVLIDCIIDKDERVLPMIPPGGAVEDLVLN
jgi:acetolactate synthase-1/2/3 large subunit